MLIKSNQCHRTPICGDAVLYSVKATHFFNQGLETLFRVVLLIPFEIVFGHGFLILLWTRFYHGACQVIKADASGPEKAAVAGFGREDVGHGGASEIMAPGTVL